MTSKKLALPSQEMTTTIAMMRPTVAIAQTVSNECLKKTELSEQCKTLESLLKDYESNVQTLKNSIQESEKLKSEYVMRNKINQTNSESLLQAKNELLKYKCQLKSDYISTENAFKKQQLKFQKIISSYESEWQKALKQYNSDPCVLELSRLEEENKNLENKIKKIEKLRIITENEFRVFQQTLWQNFIKKVIGFCKTMKEDKSLMHLDKKSQSKIVLKPQENLKTAVGFNFFRTTVPTLNLETYTTEANTSNNPYSVDVSMFDQLSIPCENLENRNEEDLFSFIHSDLNPSTNTNVENHDEKMDIDQAPADSNTSPGDYEEEYQKQNISGKQSEYFSENPPDMGNQELWNRSQGKRFEVDEIENHSRRSKKQKTGGEKANKEDSVKDVQEENSDEGSFENQLGFYDKQMESNQLYPVGYNENYGCQFGGTTPSASSDDNSVNTNENYSPKQVTSEKPAPSSFFDQEDSFKGFSGFLGMDNDSNGSKPSIFKLF